MRDLQSVIDRLLAGGPNVVESQPETGVGLVFWLLRDPSAPEGFWMQPKPPTFSDMSDATRGFVPAPERPDGYPSDVPFLPDAPVIVHGDENGASVVWLSHDHPVRGYSLMLEQSLADGWEGPADAPLATRATRRLEVRKDDRVRLLMLEIHGNAGQLSLREYPA